MKYYQTMPPLTSVEYAELKESIRRDGINVPVIIDEDGNVIDGHHRVMIAQELGIKYPKHMVYGLSEDQKLDMSVSLNVDRRQLTREQKRQVVAAQLKRHPEKSNREHARQIGVDHKTVDAVRDSLEESGEIPHFSKREDPRTGNLTQVAVRPASTLATPSGVVIAEQRHMELVDTDTGEIVEPAPRKVTGLDGKQYTPPKPRPHVIDTAEEADLVNAKTSATRIGSGLMTLESFTVPEHRHRVLTRWWPKGKEFVPPDERELFQPKALRAIADALNQLANEMEALEHEQL